MRILYFGHKDRGVACLDALLDSGEEVVAVVTPSGDDGDAWYPSVSEAAAERGLPVHGPEDVNDPAVVADLADYDPDLGVMAGYNRILDEPLLSLPTEGVLNLHGGKLPEYRGASTLNWMIINGETEGGAAVLFADEGIDTGDIVEQATFPIAPDDTIMDVRERTNSLFPGMLVRAVEDLRAGTLSRTPQSRTEGTYWHSRRPRDGEIRWWRMTAREVHDLVRALAGPYPSAFTTYGSERLEITATSLLEETVRGVPGRIATRRRGGVVVVAADRGLVVERVAPPDGDERSATAFFDGVGDDLGRGR